MAIAFVVVWHAFHWPVGGFLGVHVFFVLSGFLITTLLLQERAERGTVSLRHFYLRRALRLLPALVAFLVAYSLVQTLRALVLQPGALDLSTSLAGVLYGLFYVSNVVQAAGVVLGVPISHLWSLATEEQFYVLWPLVLVGAFALRLGRRALAVLLVVAIGALVLHRLRLTLGDEPRARLYFAPDTTFDPILVGCLAGLWFSAGRRFAGRGAGAFAALGAGTVLALVLLVDIESRALYAGLLALFSVAAALAILAAASRGSAIGRALALPPLVFLGRISYSLYLWHPLTIEITRKLLHAPGVVALPLAVGLATASYYLVELPFLRLKRRDRDALEGRPEADASTGFASGAPARAVAEPAERRG